MALRYFRFQIFPDVIHIPPETKIPTGHSRIKAKNLRHVDSLVREGGSSQPDFPFVFWVIRTPQWIGT
ncbi:hypothetical protein Avbf_02558 [Armadillidium vulgare]|nr:hypothetical protein Avbf_02558 [Armadillidium vulgare]